MKKVFVSAGHSNTAPGVVSKDTKGTVWREAYLAMKLRDAISTALTLKGISHSTDGPQGDNDALRDAIRMARKCDGVRVEFHFNAPGEKSTGIEVLARPEHKALAQSLAAVIHGVLGTPLRGDRGWKPEDSGHHRSLAWVSQAGGLVCEVGFLSNPDEIDLIVSRFDALVKALAGWFEAQARRVVISVKMPATGGPIPRNGKEFAELLNRTNEPYPIRDEQWARLNRGDAQVPGKQPENRNVAEKHVLEVPENKPLPPAPTRNGGVGQVNTGQSISNSDTGQSKRQPLTFREKWAATIVAALSAIGMAVYKAGAWLVAHRVELLVLLAVAASLAAWWEISKLRREIRR